ncbi:FecCD family ABC transporter permease [Lysinibacillus sp. FSL W8-0992]|uniref:FecCD family ABC transporter permease n=1 Tax=Lysinibacillus sp. FSL W8-0992 TaxID=2954643 RepID=UPI0030FCB84A
MIVEEEKYAHPLAKKRRLALIMLPILLIIVSVGSLMIGQVSFSVSEVFNGIFSSEDTMARRIVWEIRMPRILTGIIIGVCLAIAGSILQGVMQNPLADPGVIGITSGAGIMAVAVMVVFPGYIIYLPIAAFLGAFVAAMIVYSLSVKKGGTSPMRIILVGVAINALCGAGTNALMILYSDRVQSVLPWLSGGLTGVGWVQFKMIIYYVLVAIVLSFYAIKHIRIMCLGDEMASLLGHNVERSRFFLIALSTLLAGIAVSVAGLIGFVGLVVPHILRLIIGGDHKYLLPTSALAGGLLVVFADTIARTVFDPIEFPVGILLAFIGGPYFLYLIHRKGNSIATN